MWTALKKLMACLLLAALLFPAKTANAGTATFVVLVIGSLVIAPVVVVALAVVSSIPAIPFVLIHSAINEKPRDEQLEERAARRDSEKNRPGYSRGYVPPE
jgi:hypothetical protein